MLIGQERAETILTHAIRHGRVSHAYLFVGPDAVGKRTAAVLFAQALNCEARNEERGMRNEEEGAGASFLIPHSSFLIPHSSFLVPCGACDSCRRIAAGTHPDMHIIVPGSKGGQNISVEQMRDVRQDVARRPIMGRRKLYLVPTAEAMNEEAANTLLKTLEEPPEYVTLVLMATSPTRVLPTVLSRCQVVPFGLVAADRIQEWLRGSGIDAEAAAALAFSAAGRPGLALRWSREPEVLERRRQVLELLEETTRVRRQAGYVRREGERPGESLAALRLAERARALSGPEEGEAEGERSAGVSSPRGAGARDAAPGRRATGAKQEKESTPPVPPVPAEGEAAPRASAKPAFLRLLELIRGYYRDLLLLAQGAPETLVWNADRLSFLRAAVGEYTPGELVSVLAAVDRCQQFLERNVAPQLALEVLFLDLLQPE